MLFIDAQQAAALSAAVRPKSGQVSPMARSGLEDGDCQVRVDTSYHI
jgi:hypothetical protein